MNKKKVIIMIAVSSLSISMLQSTAEAHSSSSHWKSHKSHKIHKKHSRFHKRHKRHHRHNRHKHVFYRHHFPSSYGKIYISLPFGAVSFRFSGEKYYFHDGHYYKRDRWGYETVPAPIGACLAHLPYGYETIYVDGHRFYEYNGVYYNHTHEGYVVIEDPRYDDKYDRRMARKENREVEADYYSNESITLKIPNNKGGYTSVTLKRSKKGFIGPQGELYEKFPKVAKLKAVYGHRE